jgi:hypothetical protein
MNQWNKMHINKWTMCANKKETFFTPSIWIFEQKYSLVVLLHLVTGMSVSWLLIRIHIPHPKAEENTLSISTVNREAFTAPTSNSCQYSFSYGVTLLVAYAIFDSCHRTWESTWKSDSSQRGNVLEKQVLLRKHLGVQSLLPVFVIRHIGVNFQFLSCGWNKSPWIHKGLYTWLWRESGKNIIYHQIIRWHSFCRVLPPQAKRANGTNHHM